MRPQAPVHRRVDQRDDLARLGDPGLHRRPDLVEAGGAVGQVELQRPLRVVEDRPVAGEDGADAVVGGQRVQPPQRVEVLAEPPVGVGDHRGAAPEDGVPGQHGPVGGQVEAERVGGVAGRRHDPQLQPAGGDDVPGAEPLVAQPQRRVERAHRGPGQLGEAGGALGVVGVAVGEQRQPDPPPGRLGGGHDRLQVPLVQRPRVDDHGQLRAGLGDEPGVGAVQRHRRGVGREDVDGAGGGRARDGAPGLPGQCGGVGHDCPP